MQNKFTLTIVNCYYWWGYEGKLFNLEGSYVIERRIVKGELYAIYMQCLHFNGTVRKKCEEKIHFKVLFIK